MRKYIAIIPHRSVKKHEVWMLKNCIESMVELEPSMIGNIIVVDDHSTEDFTAAIAKFKVKVLKLKDRGSYSKMMNSGMFAANKLGYDTVITVNNDIEHLTSFKNKLNEQFEKHAHLALIGGTLYYPTGTVQSSGINIVNGEFKDPYRKTLDVRPTEFVSMVTGAWSVQAIDRCQVAYSEDYNFGYEDVDHCVRVWVHGGSVLHLNTVRHLHHESVTRGLQVSEREVKNAETFSKRIYPYDKINARIHSLNHHIDSSWNSSPSTSAKTESS